MTPRQAYVAKRVGVLVLIGLAIFGYIHGIYWAGGINQPGNNWLHGNMPWQAGLIDFAPVFLAGAGILVTGGLVLGAEAWDALAAGYRKLPKAPTKAERLAARQAEREAIIARLERELGLGPDQAAELSSERAARIARCAHAGTRTNLYEMGVGYRVHCGRCGGVTDEVGRWV